MTFRSTHTVLGASILAFGLALAPAAVRVTASSDFTTASTPSIEHGAYLVRTMGCNDCHTPLKMGPKGPEPDMTRALTGHPADVTLPPPPPPQGPWISSSSATNTAFAGPWGVSFAANLTPDKETGLGDWTEEMFIKTMRTGLHQGKGRKVLPPMPYFMLGALTDPDIKDLFAYLQSLPAVHNRVPAPVDPEEKLF
ncbi:MAG: c-type cytochrome [Vicinamibacterales bacterium]